MYPAAAAAQQVDYQQGSAVAGSRYDPCSGYPCCIHKYLCKALTLRVHEFVSNILQAAARLSQNLKLHAQKPDQDGSEGPLQSKGSDRARKSRLTPEEAKLAKENIKKALIVERVLKFATM